MIDKITRWIAWKLPPKVLYWAVIRGYADATTGKYGHREAPAVTFDQVTKSIEEKYKLKERCAIKIVE